MIYNNLRFFHVLIIDWYPNWSLATKGAGVFFDARIPFDGGFGNLYFGELIP